MSEEPDLKLAGLSLWVFGYQFPDANDFWDGNWLNVLARSEAPGASVETCGAILRTDELEAFLQQLQVVYEKLSGYAKLECIEPNLGVVVHYVSLGHLDVTVTITPDQLTQSHKIVFGIDQTYLRPILSDGKSILSRFPVKAPHKHA